MNKYNYGYGDTKAIKEQLHQILESRMFAERKKISDDALFLANKIIICISNQDKYQSYEALELVKKIIELGLDENIPWRPDRDQLKELAKMKDKDND